jgi:hypothetical protein
MPDMIERRIREALAHETSAIALSNQLFAPGGLFSQLAASEAERRALVETPLFQEAQARVRVLERAERVGLVEAVEGLRAARAAPRTTARAPTTNGPSPPSTPAPLTKPSGT